MTTASVFIDECFMWHYEDRSAWEGGNVVRRIVGACMVEVAVATSTRSLPSVPQISTPDDVIRRGSEVVASSSEQIAADDAIDVALGWISTTRA
jgi:hypothetical protein